MTHVLKKLPKDAYLVEIDEGTSVRRVLLRAADVERSIQRVETNKTKVLAAIDKQIEEFRDILSAIQHCKLDETVLERDDLSKFGVVNAAMQGVIKGRVDLADVMKPRPIPVPTPIPPPDQPRPKKSK